MVEVVKVKDVTLKIKDSIILDKINLSVPKGMIYGFVGRNGSGKTMLMKTICGFIPNYSAYKNIEFLTSINKKVDKIKIKDMIRLVGLDPDSKKPVGKFSLGMNQRLGLAQALIDDPALLILDEPFNGLDNEGVRQIRSLLLQLKENGKTIIIASHAKEDIDLLCDRVCYMDKGRLEVG